MKTISCIVLLLLSGCATTEESSAVDELKIIELNQLEWIELE